MVTYRNRAQGETRGKMRRALMASKAVAEPVLRLPGDGWVHLLAVRLRSGLFERAYPPRLLLLEGSSAYCSSVKPSHSVFS